MSRIGTATTGELDLALEQGGMCRGQDTEAWFPLAGEGPVTRETARLERVYAAVVCRGCSVAAECLELALRVPHGRYGVWGATSERDRRALLRQRRASEAVGALSAAGELGAGEGVDGVAA